MEELEKLFMYCKDTKLKAIHTILFMFVGTAGIQFQNK